MIDRDNLRETWRLAAVEWVEADDRASRLEEGRSILLNELINSLIENGVKSRADAERTARTSEEWKKYVRRMHDARRSANLAKVEERNRDRIYWDAASQEANARAERRMG